VAVSARPTSRRGLGHGPMGHAVRSEPRCSSCASIGFSARSAAPTPRRGIGPSPMAAGAMDRLVRPPRRAVEVGDDKPAVAAPVGAADIPPGDRLPLGVPGRGGTTELGVAAGRGRLAGATADRRVLGQVPDLAEQHLVAAAAADVADAVPLQPAHGVGPTIVAVAADHAVDGRPVAADRAHAMAPHERHRGPARGLARPQDHRHRLAAAGLVDGEQRRCSPAGSSARHGERRTAPAAGGRARGPRYRPRPTNGVRADPGARSSPIRRGTCSKPAPT
jgi:hypothetical protein